MSETFLSSFESAAIGSAAVVGLALAAIILRSATRIPDYRRIYVERYGFILPKRWQVHHINKNRRDNRAANLVAVPYGLHRAYHSNEFALGKVEFLVRNGNGGAFQKARTAADEMLKAAEFIGLCYENRKNAAKLKRIDELFDGRNDSTPDRDPWQI